MTPKRLCRRRRVRYIRNFGLGDCALKVQRERDIGIIPEFQMCAHFLLIYTIRYIYRNSFPRLRVLPFYTSKDIVEPLQMSIFRHPSLSVFPSLTAD
jgi:hypothetical protein